MDARDARHRLRLLGRGLVVASVLLPGSLGLGYGWNGVLDYDELRVLAVLFSATFLPGILIVACNRMRLAILAALVALIMLGYFSANHSVVECENATAQWLASDVAGDGRFWIPADDHADDARRIFRRVNAEYDVAPSSSPHLPWCSVGPGQTALPFLVTVEYGWVREPLLGQGGRKVYFCLFGYCIEVSDSFDWAA